MQHDAHARAFWDHIMDEILACLDHAARRGQAAIALHGWQDWSRYAAQGEW